MPYPGECDDHGDAYGRLVGLNLLQGLSPRGDASASAASPAAPT